VELTRDDMQLRLKRLDEDAFLLFEGDERFRIVLVGGSALVLRDILSRSTHDLDVLVASRDLRPLFAKYDFDTDVRTFINHFPRDFETRLVPLMSGKKIDYYTASLEDIVIAKLFSTREKDLLDLESDNLLNNLDWDLLDQIATSPEEVEHNVISSMSYENFCLSYADYVRRHRP
jgi:hypothetical protein